MKEFLHLKFQIRRDDYQKVITESLEDKEVFL